MSCTGPVGLTQATGARLFANLGDADVQLEQVRAVEAPASRT
jgi:hypothetical protein